MSQAAETDPEETVKHLFQASMIQVPDSWTIEQARDYVTEKLLSSQAEKDSLIVADNIEFRSFLSPSKPDLEERIPPRTEKGRSTT